MVHPDKCKHPQAKEAFGGANLCFDTLCAELNTFISGFHFISVVLISLCLRYNHFDIVL